MLNEFHEYYLLLNETDVLKSGHYTTLCVMNTWQKCRLTNSSLCIITVTLVLIDSSALSLHFRLVK